MHSLQKQEQGSSCSIRVIATHTIADHMNNVDGLVNCTTQGTSASPQSAFPIEMIGTQQWGFDAVYTPLQTRFLIACQKAGLDTLSGFDLWVFQGIDAFNNFTGAEVCASKALLEYARNLVN